MVNIKCFFIFLCAHIFSAVAIGLFWLFVWSPCAICATIQSVRQMVYTLLQIYCFYFCWLCHSVKHIHMTIHTISYLLLVALEAQQPCRTQNKNDVEKLLFSPLSSLFNESKKAKRVREKIKNLTREHRKSLQNRKHQYHQPFSFFAPTN